MGFNSGFKGLRQKFSTQKRGQDKTRHFRRSSAAFVMIPASYVNWILLREEPGTQLKAYAATFWEIKKSENYVEIVAELLSTYRALWCNMLKLHFLQSHLDFFSREIRDPSLTNKVKSSMRIYPAWGKDTAADRTQICWLIAAGSWYERHQRIQDTKDNKTSLWCYIYLSL